MITRLAANKAHRLLEFLRIHLPLSQPIFNSISASIIFDANFSSIYTKENSSSLVAATDRHPLTNVQNLNIFWDPTEHRDEDIHDFLLQIPTLQWGQPIYLHNINMSLSDRMSKILASPHLIGGKLQKIRRDIDILGFNPKNSIAPELFEGLPDDFPSGLNRMEPELEKTFRRKLDDYIKARMPENFEVSSLREEDLANALSRWYHRPVDPRNFLELFRKFPARAAYKKDEDGSSTLAIFYYMANAGIGSAGFTLPEYRRLGLSTLMLTSLCCHMFSRGILPMGTMRSEGRDDLSDLFRKCGLVTKVAHAFHEIHYSHDDSSVIMPYY